MRYMLCAPSHAFKAWLWDWKKARAWDHLDGGSLGGRVLVGVLAGVKVPGRQLVPGGGLQLEFLSVGSRQVVRLGVEVERAGDGHGGDNLGDITAWAFRGHCCISVITGFNGKLYVRNLYFTTFQSCV